MFTQGLLLYYNIFFAFFQAHSLCRQDFRIYKISRETIALFLSLNLYLQPWRVLVATQFYGRTQYKCFGIKKVYESH